MLNQDAGRENQPRIVGRYSFCYVAQVEPVPIIQAGIVVIDTNKG